VISLDTNLVVRLVMKDDPAQMKRVARVIEEAEAQQEECLLTDVVLCELEWVLGSVFNVPRRKILNAVQTLMAEPLFQPESFSRLQRALDAYSQGKGDLSDYLLGEAASGLGARTTFTFDKALQRHPAFTVLRS